MRWPDILALRLRSLFRRDRVEDDLDTELQFHLQQQVEEHVAAGLGVEDARSAAWRSLGSVTFVKDQCRDSLGLRLLGNVQDVRYASPVRPESRFYDRLTRDLAAMPGIEAVTAIQNLSASNVDTPRRPVVIEGHRSTAERGEPVADVQSANAAFFQVFSVRLRRGRLLAPSDGPESARVAVISDTMATRFWPGQDAIGRRLQIGRAEPAMRWVTVVGVVDDVKQNWVDPEPHAIL